MITVLNILLFFATAILCVPALVFCREVLLALLPRRSDAPRELPANARLAVLIPAHNEQAVISATLSSLLPTIPANTRVLVVADNCTDATAATARELGAEVVERQDRHRRGKGFALDFGIRHLSQE